MLFEEQTIHVNESEEEIVPVCANCRHQGTALCDLWEKNKRQYKERTGNPRKKQFCKFWSYKPVGLWNNDVETYIQT